ncbi:hypothetical protein ACKI14_46310 [Streptomyces turgidiscabies]|uniref:hypothetical protein n=1 Tax=Streptomyces turgidiscabies TaxID=85558 RepID=UPI0038F789D3
MLHAFIDESARRRAGETTCVYTLAAVLVDDASAETVRTAMEGLRYGKSAVVHWRVERAQRRAFLAAEVAALPIVGVVAVCLHDAEVKSERARRLCLVQLLGELSARGVGRVVFESRQAQDASDRAVLTGLRKSNAVATDMLVTWQMASSDPALWAADVVAGACSWWLDGDGQFWTPLEPLVTLLDVEAR